MVEEGWAFIAVGGSTGSIHANGHAWWTTGEHADLWQQDVLLLEVVKERVEVWTPKVGDGA